MLRASFPRVPDTNEALPAGCRGRVKAGGVGKTCVHRKPMLATRREDWSIQLKTKDFTPLRGAWGLERRGSGGGGGGGQGAWPLVISQGGGQEFTCCCGLDQGAKGAMRG